MSSVLAPSPVPPELFSAIDELDGEITPLEERRALLTRAYELSTGREKPGRYWKIDLDAPDLSSVSVTRASEPQIQQPEHSTIIACDLATAARKYPELLSRVWGRAATIPERKYAALSAALCNTGAFVYVPADLSIDRPLEITYEGGSRGLFPHTLVLVEHGAQCSIVERITGGAHGFVAGITEIVTGENAHVTYASEQSLDSDARIFFTRSALPGKESMLALCLAELGAALSAGTVDVRIETRGVDASLNAFFFPAGDQHVDLVSTFDHQAGGSHSETLVKSVATGSGQARYLGNIRIAPHAQATQASLRDDALLLSKHAHIDSIPALEIGANDVKAYHGATIGSLDEEQLFYMTTRGIDRPSAERMIALGFFDPVLERFPTKALRERLHAALQAKVAA